MAESLFPVSLSNYPLNIGSIFVVLKSWERNILWCIVIRPGSLFHVDLLLLLRLALCSGKVLWDLKVVLKYGYVTATQPVLHIVVKTRLSSFWSLISLIIRVLFDFTFSRCLFLEYIDQFVHLLDWCWVTTLGCLTFIEIHDLPILFLGCIGVDSRIVKTLWRACWRYVTFSYFHLAQSSHLSGEVSFSVDNEIELLERLLLKNA